MIEVTPGRDCPEINKMAGMGHGGRDGTLITGKNSAAIICLFPEFVHVFLPLQAS